LTTFLTNVVGSRWLRAFGVFCVVLIVLLSLIPGSWQARTPLPGPVEHFIAYAGTAAVAVLAFRRVHWRTWLLLVVALSAFSALMEELQHFSPGRDPQVIGFVASSLGALAGAVFGWLVRSTART
jgi:VanZ family protein